MPQSRHLAAIMFTDIVGYTAMMQQNEEKAVAVIKHYNATLEKWVTHFNGQVLNYYGDGSLCIFSSATDAVNCSLAVQKDLKTEPVVPLRIGLHIGEVFFEDSKALGDGVNVASRVQSLGQENTILISGEIHDKIKNNASITTVSLGHFEFKNVGKAMEVFALTNEGLFVPQRKKMEGKLKKKNVQKRNVIAALSIVLFIVAAFFIYTNFFAKNDKAEVTDKSIAVLPFVNISNDPEQEYFSDGITEDIITQVSKIGDLKVISRTAIMQYKATKKTMKEIGKELDVKTILEGSVRRAGNQVRVVAQLINVRTNEHLWAETYDKDFTQIFEIQSKVAEQIASALKAKFIAPDKEKFGGKSPESLEAYDYYLRGKFYFHEDNKPGVDTSIIIFERAVTLDPKFALGYAAIALAYTEKFFTYDPQKIWREQAFVALEKAIALDPNLPETYFARAKLLWIPENHFPHEQTVAALRQALSLRPNYKEARNLLSTIYSHIGLHDKAFIEVHKALALNPLDMETLSQTGSQFYYQQKYAEMLAVFEKLPKDFGGPFKACRIAEVLYRTGMRDEAELRIGELLKQFPDNVNTNSIAAIFSAASGNKIFAEQRIQVAIMHGKNLGHFHHTTYNIGVAYALMNNHTEAIRWLQMTAEDGMPCYTLFANDPYLNNLRSDAEFKSLLETLKKQWEHFKATL